MTEVNTTDEWADGRAQQQRGVVDTDHGAALARVIDVLRRHQRTRGTWRTWLRPVSRISTVCAVGVRHVYPGSLYDLHDNQHGSTLHESDTSARAHGEPVCMLRERRHTDMDTK